MTRLQNPEMREKLERDKENARKAGEQMRAAMATAPHAPTTKVQTKLHRHRRYNGPRALPKMRYSPEFYVIQERMRKMHACGAIGGARFNVLLEIARNADQRGEIHMFDLPAECRKLDNAHR